MATLSYALPAALAAVTGLLGIWAWIDARLKTVKSDIRMQDTPFNVRTLERCKHILEPYQPVPFLTNGHVETIFAAKCRSSPTSITYQREVLHMSDNGSVALDWELHEQAELPHDAPVLILLPGLTGGSGDSYVLHAVERSRQRGIRAVVFNSRGTADSPVTTPQFYSASFTEDMRNVVAHVRQKYPQSIMMAAGWSLGANIMVRYLGEEGSSTPLRAAVSMCNPFDLTISNAHFERGFNRIYDRNLASSLRNIFMKHQLLWNGVKGKFRPDLVPGCKTIREFDEYITINSFGWPDVDTYYARSSSSLSVPKVTIPLLCIQALDDPIAPKEAIPYDALVANPNCILVCTPCGGHLGWVAGDGGLTGHPWSDEAMLQWLDSVLIELKARQDTGPGGPPSGSGSGKEGKVAVDVAVGAGVPAPAAAAMAVASEEASAAVLAFEDAHVAGLAGAQAEGASPASASDWEHVPPCTPPRSAAAAQSAVAGGAASGTPPCVLAAAGVDVSAGAGSSAASAPSSPEVSSRLGAQPVAEAVVALQAAAAHTPSRFGVPTLLRVGALLGLAGPAPAAQAGPSGAEQAGANADGDGDACSSDSSRSISPERMARLQFESMRFAF